MASTLHVFVAGGILQGAGVLQGEAGKSASENKSDVFAIQALLIDVSFNPHSNLMIAY